MSQSSSIEELTRRGPSQHSLRSSASTRPPGATVEGISGLRIRALGRNPNGPIDRKYT